MRTMVVKYVSYIEYMSYVDQHDSFSYFQFKHTPELTHNGAYMIPAWIRAWADGSCAKRHEGTVIISSVSLASL